jgi:hypothetical protein
VANKMTDTVVKEWRPPGSRNYIRVGDIVKVAPSQPKKRDGFEARVMAIDVDADGTGATFQLLGGARGRLHTRFIRDGRISRVAQIRTSADGIVTTRERKR